MKTVNVKNVDRGQPLIVRKGMKMSNVAEVVSSDLRVWCTVFKSDTDDAPSVLLTYASEWLRGKRPLDPPVMSFIKGHGKCWTLEVYVNFEGEEI